MEVDEITRIFHEASKYRNDHLRKAIGCFQGNTLTDDALEKARSKSGRYVNTPENRKLGRVGLPYKGAKQFPAPHQRRNSKNRRNDTYIHTLTVGDGNESVEIDDDGVARNDFYDNEEVGEYAKKHYEKVNIGDRVRYNRKVYTVYTTKKLTENGVERQYVQFVGKPSYSGAPRGTGKWIPRKDAEKL